ncbi:MAG: type II toxin-antitoxin system prevent-host-death family antitoxin [Candidatus Levybacteria bacterium]|nr:type II toxin-antitoxin system prevent-host-death family antitoxin [Candidatus Levybacteria bacterium]
MSNLMSISDVRQQLPNLVAKVSKYLDRVVITVKGQPKATLISAEELESLEETAEILAIPGALRSIKKGIEQIKKGEFVRLSDLK